MRHFIFTILLVVPLLLTAQSKKEQIATLNLRVDSLFEVLINERVNNEQTLSDKSDKIFQLSQEKSALEKNIVQLSQEKGGLEKEIAEKKVFFGELKQELRLALNELDVLNTELDNANFNGATELQIQKIEAREYKANDRAYSICASMTEEEFDATTFEDIMCMDYATACDMG